MMIILLKEKMGALGMGQLEKKFGVVVRKKRHALGLSQEAFAEKADVHRTYISDIELGKVNVGIAVAEKLAGALNASLSHLIREAEAEYKVKSK
jgi:transcriptional regulator with XRE-family HTH domain